MYRVALAMTAEASREQLEEIVQTDWAHDSEGREGISFEAFKDSVFQLADLWIDRMEPDAYATFMDRLLDTITTEDGKAFLDEDAIERGVARPPGYPEDEERIAQRVAREEMQVLA